MNSTQVFKYKTLLQFFHDVNRWVADGALSGYPMFYRSAGLCTNYILWWKVSHLDRSSAAHFFDHWLESKYANHTTPFNSSYSDYLAEACDGGHWRNPKRLQFIADSILDLTNLLEGS